MQTQDSVDRKNICAVKDFILNLEVMSEDDPLYRREILRLAADAVGAGHLPAPDCVATVHNPACGDRVTVELTLADGTVMGLAHTVEACVLAQASASLLAMEAPRRDRAALAALAEAVRSFLKGGTAPAGFEPFAGVAGHAGRHICVLLPFEAALKALENRLEGAEPGAMRAETQSGS